MRVHDSTDVIAASTPRQVREVIENGWSVK
jgi:hypothetical protein